MAQGAVVRKIIKDLAGCGYEVNWDILNAADYGVPQNRRRVIILGKRIDLIRADFDSGRAVLCLGVGRGVAHHPDWFEKKYPPPQRVTRSRAANRAEKIRAALMEHV
jgi:site-specific DNA-cytosine methylase